MLRPDGDGSKDHPPTGPISNFFANFIRSNRAHGAAEPPDTHLMQRRANRTARGYTLIEMIMVIVVVSVLGGTVLVKLSAVKQRSVGDQGDLLRRDLGHIQSLGLSYGVPLRLKINTVVTSTGTTVSYSVLCAAATVTQCTDKGIVVQFPSDLVVTDPSTGKPYTVTLPSGMSLTASDGANAAVTTADFDSAGRPSASGAPIATNPARKFIVATTTTATVRNATVNLRPITGFAEVSYGP